MNVLEETPEPVPASAAADMFTEPLPPLSKDSLAAFGDWLKGVFRGGEA